MIYNAVTRRRVALPLLASLALLGACNEPDMPLTIPFAAYYGQHPIACDRAAGSVQLTDLRFYVSEIHALNDAGERIRVSLQPDDQWQRNDLALLDFEDAGDRCENGTSASREYLRGSLPPGNYRGLMFSVGVPFDRNHHDPLLAEPPLGDSAMHWSWRGGYKFLRAGIRTETDGFWVHLGSTGCAGKINDITGCSAANRVAVMLADFEPGQHKVAIDLAQLFDGIDLGDSQPTDCSSGPAEQHCDVVFTALGLNFGTGAGVGQQRVFTSRALD